MDIDVEYGKKKRALELKSDLDKVVSQVRGLPGKITRKDLAEVRTSIRRPHLLGDVVETLFCLFDDQSKESYNWEHVTRKRLDFTSIRKKMKYFDSYSCGRDTFLFVEKQTKNLPVEEIRKKNKSMGDILEWIRVQPTRGEIRKELDPLVSDLGGKDTTGLNWVEIAKSVSQRTQFLELDAKAPKDHDGRLQELFEEKLKLEKGIQEESKRSCDARTALCRGIYTETVAQMNRRDIVALSAFVHPPENLLKLCGLICRLLYPADCEAEKFHFGMSFSTVKSWKFCKKLILIRVDLCGLMKSFQCGSVDKCVWDDILSIWSESKKNNDDEPHNEDDVGGDLSVTRMSRISRLGGHFAKWLRLQIDMYHLLGEKCVLMQTRLRKVIKEEIFLKKVKVMREKDLLERKKRKEQQ